MTRMHGLRHTGDRGGFTKACYHGNNKTAKTKKRSSPLQHGVLLAALLGALLHRRHMLALITRSSGLRYIFTDCVCLWSIFTGVCCALRLKFVPPTARSDPSEQHNNTNIYWNVFILNDQTTHIRVKERINTPEQKMEVIEQLELRYELIYR